MDKLIGFFSSDARPLYIEDIYRAMALPEKSIIHFRYNQKYVQDDIVSDSSKYVNREGIIFFTTGNDLEKTPEDREIKHHSIRKVRIKSIYKSEDTRYFHFLLELGDYYDCEITNTEQNKFAAFVSVKEGINHCWIDRVKAIESYFEDILFFKYEILSKNEKKKLFPKYSKSYKDTIYQLNDESDYKILFSFYDKKNGDSKLNINDSEYIDIHYKECSKIGALIDDRYFNLSTRTIHQRKKNEILKISPSLPKNSKLSYEVVTRFEITKSYKKAIFYGFLSSFLFISIVLSQVVGALIKLEKPTSCVVIVGVIALFFFFIGSSLLLSNFSKK
ncbi:MAG: hypothetical protein KAJ18_07320 [Candidatus Omnitrophica bacterium]|nr:hypothetical protein [Candidatus Omnitrophota bacterium]